MKRFIQEFFEWLTIGDGLEERERLELARARVAYRRQQRETRW